MQDGPIPLMPDSDDADETHPVEVEVKLRADAQGLAEASRSSAFAASAGRARLLRSIYYDTPDLALHRAGIVLRMRHEGRARPLMCIKFDVTAGSALFHRHEIEVTAEGPEPDIDLFGKKTARRLKRLLRGLPLEAKFETAVTRRVRTAAAGESLIEAAFDEGHVVLPDGRKEPLCELELELKSGKAGDLFDLARRLAAEHPLRLDVTSKSEKGFALLKTEAAKPVKAQRVALQPGADDKSVVREILSSATHHFTANWEALRTGDDPESIHQARVALRRMRTAFRMFERVIPLDELSALKEEAGRIAAGFGRARDLDALLDVAAAIPPQAGAGAGLQSLMAEVRRQRSEAFAASRALLDRAAVTDFVLRVEAFASSVPALPVPPGEAAGVMLSWLYRRVKKRGRRIARQNEEERHRLRIALKDLRYGIEFFSGLHGHEARAKRMAEAAAVLQDILGRGNDAAVGAVLAREVAHPLGPDGAVAASYLAGWMARGAVLERDGLRAAWKDFRKCRDFWKT